ncbi:phosphoglycerate dehydrogenase [Staphylococcus caeli]|uniref:phosphoglycerate dehydrogenase n=1 Tax=Staphylococcus caeli TaxID=2201815 RepID=UPI003F555ABA
MKAVSLMRMGELEKQLIEAFPNVEFIFTNGVSDITDEDKKSMNILFGYDGEVNERFLRNCPQLKWIAWYATGVNNLPLQYISENNIKLTNGKGVHAKQMSEFIFAYILNDYKNMKTSYINQKNKYYDSSLTGKRVSGETILFLGTGSIAKKTASIANVMGMNVIGINTTGHEVINFSKTYAMKDLDDVLPIADIVVNTLPETKETIHLLESREFEVMKESVLFINVGRGTIVKESILIDALKQNQIRHACLDVFENEPLAPGNELYHLDNVTITAHITGNGSENKMEVTEIFKKNLDSILNNGDLIENEVNPDSGY